MFVGSDGGVGLTADGGRTWDTRQNKHVLSLEIYESRGFDPAPFDVNTAVEGIALCATQDNGNLWCPLDGMVSRSFPPWDAFRKFDGGDGLTTVLLDNASALWANGAFSKSGEVRIAALENTPSFPIFFAPPGDVIQVAGENRPLKRSAMARPRLATLDHDKETVLAFASEGSTVYFLNRSQPAVFKRLGDVSGRISCLASYNGEEVLVGTDDGQIFILEKVSGKVTTQDVDQANAARRISRLLWSASADRFALNQDGRILRWRGTRWEVLPTGPSRAVFALEFTPSLGDGVLFACTSYAVLASEDYGDTWVQASEGLPAQVPWDKFANCFI